MADNGIHYLCQNLTSMLKEERQRLILSEVELHNRVPLTDLPDTLEVSRNWIQNKSCARCTVGQSLWALLHCRL